MTHKKWDYILLLVALAVTISGCDSEAFSAAVSTSNAGGTATRAARTNAAATRTAIWQNCLESTYGCPFRQPPKITYVLRVYQTSTMTPTLTPTPIALVTMLSHCRSGPGMMYPTVLYLMPGEMLTLRGYAILDGSTWFLVYKADSRVKCWISQSVTEIFSLGDLPIIEPPPTPTPPPPGGSGDGGGVSCNPTADEAECPAWLWNGFYCDCSVLCSSFGDQAGCEAHSSWDCEWTGSMCIIGSG